MERLNTLEDAESLAQMITDSARWLSRLKWERTTQNFELAWALLDAAGRIHAR